MHVSKKVRNELEISRLISEAKVKWKLHSLSCFIKGEPHVKKSMLAVIGWKYPRNFSTLFFFWGFPLLDHQHFRYPLSACKVKLSWGPFDARVIWATELLTTPWRYIEGILKATLKILQKFPTAFAGTSGCVGILTSRLQINPLPASDAVRQQKKIF